jgi:hypothetical protein
MVNVSNVKTIHEMKQERREMSVDEIETILNKNSISNFFQNINTRVVLSINKLISYI